MAERGWYQDPTDSTRLRWYDGAAWSDQTESPPTPDEAGQVVRFTVHRDRSTIRMVAASIATLVAVAAAFVATSGGKDSSDSKSNGSASVAVDTTTTIPRPTRVLYGTVNVDAENSGIRKVVRLVEDSGTPEPSVNHPECIPEKTDIRLGAKVTVSDQAQKAVASGRIQSSEWTDLYDVEADNEVTTLGRCVLSFRVLDIPLLPSYGVEVGRRGVVTYAAAALDEAEWSIELVLER